MPEPKLIQALPPHRCSAGEQIRNESHLWPLDGSLLAVESHPKGTMDDAEVIELILELKVVVDCMPNLSVQRVEDFRSSWAGRAKSHSSMCIHQSSIALLKTLLLFLWIRGLSKVSPASKVGTSGGVLFARFAVLLAPCSELGFPKTEGLNKFKSKVRSNTRRELCIGTEPMVRTIPGCH